MSGRNGAGREHLASDGATSIDGDRVENDRDPVRSRRSWRSVHRHWAHRADGRLIQRGDGLRHDEDSSERTAQRQRLKPGDIVYCLRGCTIGEDCADHFASERLHRRLVIASSYCARHVTEYLTTFLL